MRRAEIRASSKRYCVTGCLHVCSSMLVRAVIRKLHVDSEVFFFQLGDDVLQRVAIFAGDAHNIGLNRSLHLCL